MVLLFEKMRFLKYGMIFTFFIRVFTSMQFMYSGSKALVTIFYKRKTKYISFKYLWIRFSCSLFMQFVIQLYSLTKKSCRINLGQIKIELRIIILYTITFVSECIVIDIACNVAFTVKYELYSVYLYTLVYCLYFFTVVFCCLALQAADNSRAP